ncbi:hypothetical protein RRG08_043184 [Elysia crispata]|uniref:Uncharacterized protein n=1 Tax=Elysia crispata TaxID=231223 RepID=A0AAE0ZKB2_9GAST|nr:hypothetical protein RRG08_043184 [Elysia crispata]
MRITKIACHVNIRRAVGHKHGCGQKQFIESDNGRFKFDRDRDLGLAVGESCGSRDQAQTWPVRYAVENSPQSQTGVKRSRRWP